MSLNATFATFTDGKTSYAKQVMLDAPAKQLQVEVQNSGYRKLPYDRRRPRAYESVATGTRPERGALVLGRRKVARWAGW